MREQRTEEWGSRQEKRLEDRHGRRPEHSYGRRRRQQRALRRKIFGFCLFTFLLGVWFGRLVFAKEAGMPVLIQTMQEGLQAAGKEGTENTDSTGNSGKETQQGSRSSSMDQGKEGDWKLTLVNRSHPLEDGYVPELAEIENNYYFDARAVGFLQEMLADGRKEGLDFWVCSAYRTIEKQTELYENKVRRLEAEGMSHGTALQEAGTVVAYPGTSEHNLGLAVDIVAKDYQILDEKQEKTDEQQWLMENCWKYGFILRYPTDKTEETGIIYEPWHYRYVGQEAAREIMEQGICLEEYLGEV